MDGAVRGGVVALCSLALAAGLWFASGWQGAAAAPTEVAGVAGGQHKGAAKTVLPTPKHVVIVIEENKSYSDIIGSKHAPYINSLARQGALFSQSYAVSHPSEPNYLALFSGSTQNIGDDSCPHTFSGPNLASELLRHGKTFGIYSESLPKVGFTGCQAGAYWRKHNPAVNWQGVNIPRFANMPFLLFTIVAGDYSHLPPVSIVVPNQNHDMHNGTIRQGDNWLEKNIAPYVQWAQFHDSLLIVTWDEDDGSGDNRIPTLFVGPMVKPGVYAQHINHYDVLRTLEDMFGLKPLGHSAEAKPITGIWIRNAGMHKSAALPAVKAISK